MDDIKLLIQNARKERESGNASKSLSMFLEIDKSKLSESQVYDYLGEVGLTYFHLKDFENAKKIFEEALQKSQIENKLSYQALFLRHLSKREFNTDLNNLVSTSIKAREIAEKADRKDLVWFDQGVISSLIISNASKVELEKWIEKESVDLLAVSKELKDDLALWVWVTGILIEKFHIYKNMSDLNLALIISEKFSLERRKEQILSLQNNHIN